MTIPLAIDIPRSTVLITGGASGIGLALATRLRSAGATVVVCGRRRGQLEVAAGLGLHTFVADVADEAGRVALAARVVPEFGYQSAETRRLASRAELDAAFAAMNARG